MAPSSSTAPSASGATEDGRPGHPILFDHNLFGELLNMRGDMGAKSVIDAHKDRLRLVPLPGNRALTDLDTPEDWAAWRAGRSQDSRDNI